MTQNGPRRQQGSPVLVDFSERFNQNNTINCSQRFELERIYSLMSQAFSVRPARPLLPSLQPRPLRLPLLSIFRNLVLPCPAGSSDYPLALLPLLKRHMWRFLLQVPNPHQQSPGRPWLTPPNPNLNPKAEKALYEVLFVLWPSWSLYHFLPHVAKRLSSS